MSFITKRERVFNEYDLFDLPARNEGKLKTYASCTDARAWSHFCSDKSEHLVEIIKRNNETVRPKYIPTDVIVNTLMSVKNAEIVRLKRKIEEFEQMLSAYDELDLTSEQKCEIANAHAAIKAANKELDDMCLDLDLSGFTEGIDSEAFEDLMKVIGYKGRKSIRENKNNEQDLVTGKSRGDEPSRHAIMDETGKSGRGEHTKTQAEEWSFDKDKESTPRKETKSSQAGPPCTCDASTSAHDTQVDEMQETIINKDAKLSAMQNTIAVMEHDVCEPYCIYAHIYTALEKIFGTLCQNGKYKEYLDLLTAGKDTRGIDIKGKIMFKLKVLEKFSLALIAPCSQEFSRASQDCSCLRAEVVTTFALTSAEIPISSIDNKRAQLVADIMENQDMKEILSKESLCLKIEDDQYDECYGFDYCSIDIDNLNRLKNLQTNYDELLTCYDNLKHERDGLYSRCQRVADLEHECDCLKNNLREYNQLWKEKEFYQKRSEDLDTLKENYYVLSEETLNIETKLKAEQEINKKKSQTVDQLRNENIKLEQKIGDVSVLFEKQKNALICKLKECDCKIMCQNQQIKSLSDQIDTLLDQDRNKIASIEDALPSVQLMEEIDSQKEQIKNLKDDLCCSEEEKHILQEEFEKKLELINELKHDVEDWKSRYEEALKGYSYLQMQVDELQVNNSLMKQELENKTSAINNLNNIICSKSREIGNLMETVDNTKELNLNLVEQIKNSRDSFDKNIATLVNEKKVAMNSILMAKQESIQLLKNLKDHSNTNQISESTENISEILATHENNDNDILLKEIELLNETNLENINILKDENAHLRKSYDLAKAESLILKQKLLDHENVLEKFQKLKESHEKLLNEKELLQLDLNHSKYELHNLLQDFQLTKTKSEGLLDESDDMKDKFAMLNTKYQQAQNERNILQNLIVTKDSEIKNMTQTLYSLKLEYANLQTKLQEIPELQHTLCEIQNKYEILLSEKDLLNSDIDIKNREIIDLNLNLEIKTEENRRLHNELKMQQCRELSASESISNLRKENHNMKVNLNAVKNESALLLDRLKHYEILEEQYKELQLTQKQLQLENEKLQKDFIDMKKIQQDNYEYSGSLEKALICSRDENISKTNSVNDFYTDLKKEVDKLKEEKLKSRNEMKCLMEKLDESEYIITNLNENILAREKKISTLENHINELQVEITALQNDLKEFVESGEQLKQLSYEKLDLTVKQIEAHHSKATHNMKMDLTKIQNEKENLEHQLSTTKLITEESVKETINNTSIINQLQRERELIISDIKQLEINSIGDSNLLPSKCSIKDVIASLDRIGKYINNKNSSLEQTLLNVQASYQLLKSKADEAKNIAEKEQQKMIYEEEQTKKERKGVEKQLDNLKAKINDEKANYENIIKDLEGEMLNQKLIFDKIKQSKEDHILNLIEENQILRGQCDTFDTEIKKVKQELIYASEEKSRDLDLIQKTNRALEKKHELVLILQKQIEEIKNKPTKQTGIQTVSFYFKDDTCQTDKHKDSDENANFVCENVQNKNNDKFPMSDISIEKDFQKSHKIQDVHPIGPPINEVQILTANVEPKIDFVRNMYLKYKMKRLSPGKLEQHSIASIKDTYNTSGQGRTSSNEVLSEPQLPESLNSRNFSPESNLNKDSIIDIYNTQISTDSTKITATGDISNKECPSLMTDLEHNNQVFRDTDTSNKNDGERDINVKDSFPWTENDLFVIYKDSNSINSAQKFPQNDTSGKQKTIQNKSIQLNKEEKIYLSGNTTDDSARPKLKISVPRVSDESPSRITNSDDDRKSLDSFSSPQWEFQSESNKEPKEKGLNILSIPAASKNHIKNVYPEKKSMQQYLDNNSQNIRPNRVKLDDPVNNKTTHSHNSKHKLPRVDARMLVLENNVNDILGEHSEDFNVKSNYGLQYILNTVRNEINPKIIKDVNLNKSIRKCRSIDRFFDISETSQSKQMSPLKISSVENGTTSTYSAQLTSSVERGTLVKMDCTEDYENKIQQLSKALENIEKHYRTKMKAVKVQYDSNVKCIINEHNHGVKNIQNLHEEIVLDMKKEHENEVENLQTMSIESMRKAEKLQIENRGLKSKFNNDTSIDLSEEPIKILSADLKKRKCRCRVNNKTLTKTNVEAFNVKPKKRCQGPCTCSLDMNLSDTIRSILEQVDVDQRKLAEQAYLKYIAKKILECNVEKLDAQELSFLHLKVCRMWKTKLTIEEAKEMKIHSLKTEFKNKQRQTHRHMDELDRKVAEEKRRLQEVSEALCFSTESRDVSPISPSMLANAPEKDVCSSNTIVGVRQSAEDLTSKQYGAISTNWKRKRGKLESNRAVLAKIDSYDGRRDKALVTDETPTRLKRDRHHTRTHKK